MWNRSQPEGRVRKWASLYHSRRRPPGGLVTYGPWSSDRSPNGSTKACPWGGRKLQRLPMGVLWRGEPGSLGKRRGSRDPQTPAQTRSLAQLWGRGAGRAVAPERQHAQPTVLAVAACLPAPGAAAQWRALGGRGGGAWAAAVARGRGTRKSAAAEAVSVRLGARAGGLLSAKGRRGIPGVGLWGRE